MNEVLSALQTLYTDPSNAAKEQANQWLQSFQKEPQAWETANLILASPDAPPEPKLFAAQTFRTKIIYDLEQLPQEHRLPLKDTLVTALRNASAPAGASSSRAIVTQLCIAVADLLLQLPEWQNALQEMIDQLGSSPGTVAALLEFLSILPEEANTNRRIREPSMAWRTDETGPQVVSLVSMYFQADGVTAKVRQQTLQCLASWLRAGEIIPALVQDSPFFDFAFTSLGNDELFDDSIDLLCDLIHETQEIGDNMGVIQAIVPRLVQLRPSMAAAAAQEDTDTVRGYCRLFVEAGEWYAQLMLQHPADFIPIVEAILDASAYDDLDVVSITLNFWWKLAVGLRKGGFVQDPGCAPFLDIISRLVEVVIRHLRYPDNVDTFTGQDRDDFRSFRHNIGDTLKDCCSVLGATACLARSFSIIEAELAKQPGSGGGAAGAADGSGEWQTVEAALFSIRTMGAQVDPGEDTVMPRLFAAIPALPQQQSKIRYSATLVVGRYTEWLAVHPDLIPGMLQYVLGGFSVAQDEVAVASASALKHLCQDCAPHLVAYLPPLFEFTQQHGSKLHQDDLLDIYAGYAHVIATMPPADAIPALQTFVGPMLGRIQQLAARPAGNGNGNASKQELDSVADALEQLNVFLTVNAELSAHLPDACAGTAAEIWALLASLIAQFGGSSIAERLCSTLRRGLAFFGRLCLPLAPAILDTVTQAFEKTGVSGYVWVGGRCSDLLRYQYETGNAQGVAELKGHLQQAFESMTNKLVGMLSSKSPQDLQDCIEDYLHLVRNLAENTPELFFLSSAFPSAVQVAITAVTLLSPTISLDGLDALRQIVGHDCLDASLSSNSGGGGGGGVAPSAPGSERAQWPAFASAIRSVLCAPEAGGRLVSIMLGRLVTDFHEDCAPVSITLFRLLSERITPQMAEWVPVAAQQIPGKDLAQGERDRFVASFGNAVGAGNLAGVRNAFVQLDRAARKERERMVSLGAMSRR